MASSSDEDFICEKTISSTSATDDDDGDEDDDDEVEPQTKKMKMFNSWKNNYKNNCNSLQQSKESLDYDDNNIDSLNQSTNNNDNYQSNRGNTSSFSYSETYENENDDDDDEDDDDDDDHDKNEDENFTEMSIQKFQNKLVSKMKVNSFKHNSNKIINNHHGGQQQNDPELMTTTTKDQIDSNEKSKEYSYSDSVGFRLMKQMGYSGGGLGKHGEGIVEPVAASAQEGRRGLGLKLEELDASALKWSTEMEEIKMPEEMFWLKNDTNDLDQLSLEDLAQLITLGNKKYTIDDETKFCDPQILANVLNSKSVFDELEDNEMRKARTRSNPFETIKGNIFLNRAAVKMANMDALCDFMFTNPVDQDGNSLVKNDDLLYFADICAGPGGFSEYVLYRKGWEAKGFGFTLRDKNDFKLDNFCAGPPETFDPNYGIKGDGNIYDPENQQSFKNYVMKQTDDCGVHFVMADGGFSVEKQENIQEILSKQLYLCQCLVALSVLRIKGHFVVKLFDLFTPFSVGLIYLMYKCFEEICICKPNTSRPANSERYLICKWRKPHTDIIERHLFYINKEMWDNPDSKTDIRELICYDELIRHKKFIEYITESNNRIGRNQIAGLIKIAAFYKNKDLKEPRQIECKVRCLELWRLPDQIRRKPEIEPIDTVLTELLHDWKEEKQFLSKQATELKSCSDLHKYIKSIYDWYFVPISREETEKNIRTLFLSQGRKNIVRYTSNGNWQPIQDLNLEISPKTLLYGEVVTELIGEGRSQSKVNALHIIDAVALGGKDIRRHSLNERNKLCEKFSKALNKPYKIVEDKDEIQLPYAPIRCKKLFSLTEFHKFFDCMRTYKLKDGNNRRLGYRIRSDDNRAERFFVPGGIMFFNKTSADYTCHISKKTGLFYYHNAKNNQSDYIKNHANPGIFFGSFRQSYVHRLIWKWINVLQVNDNIDNTTKETDLLYKNDISHFIHEFLTK